MLEVGITNKKVLSATRLGKELIIQPGNTQVQCHDGIK